MTRACRWILALAVAIVALGPVDLAGASQVPRSSDASSPAEIAQAPIAPGSTVTIFGEAVGEILRAREGETWVNLLGEGVGVGVVMSREDASRIEHFASYRESGDILVVTGTFNQACPEHGGDLDVHATSMRIVRRGGPIAHPIRWWKLVVAVAASSVVALEVVLYRRRRALEY